MPKTLSAGKPFGMVWDFAEGVRYRGFQWRLDVMLDATWSIFWNSIGVNWVVGHVERSFRYRPSACRSMLLMRSSLIHHTMMQYPTLISLISSMFGCGELSVMTIPELFTGSSGTQRR